MTKDRKQLLNIAEITLYERDFHIDKQYNVCGGEEMYNIKASDEMLDSVKTILSMPFDLTWCEYIIAIEKSRYKAFTNVKEQMVTKGSADKVTVSIHINQSDLAVIEAAKQNRYITKGERISLLRNKSVLEFTLTLKDEVWQRV